MDQVRFNLTGTEAVQSAVRVARVFTGKRKIIKFVGQYHGWLDNVLIMEQLLSKKIWGHTTSLIQ